MYVAAVAQQRIAVIRVHVLEDVLLRLCERGIRSQHRLTGNPVRAAKAGDQAYLMRFDAEKAETADQTGADAFASFKTGHLPGRNGKIDDQTG